MRNRLQLVLDFFLITLLYLCAIFTVMYGPAIVAGIIEAEALPEFRCPQPKASVTL